MCEHLKSSCLFVNHKFLKILFIKKKKKSMQNFRRGNGFNKYVGEDTTMINNNICRDMSTNVRFNKFR